jgi:hypothetical protein
VNHAQDVYGRADASILLGLTAAPRAREDIRMKERDGLTWPQIRYWLMALLLCTVGLAALIGAQFIHIEGVRVVVGEIGVASLIAGILAGLVEPFFRQEFARDAFLAAFRYVLPDEFRQEVERIITFDLIGEKQIWTVRVQKIDDGHVLVTTNVERMFRNKSNSRKDAFCHSELEDYAFPHGPTKILECGVQVGGTVKTVYGPAIDKGHYKELRTETLYLQPRESAKIWSRSSQYRRINDAMYETFRIPIANPEIRVIINDDEFSHIAEFGPGASPPNAVIKSNLENHYTLSGVYFPGQYMLVRWWPKQEPTLDFSHPQLPGSAGTDPAG